MNDADRTDPMLDQAIARSTRQIAAFSGGKDSTAMVLAMLDRGESIDGLLVTPTGDELPDLWAHWDRIAARVGCELIRPKAPTLREAIDAVGGLPNFRMRWCTRMIKVEPMIAWAKSQTDEVVVCVGLRADEPERRGIISESLACRFPLREYAMGLAEVRAVLALHSIVVPTRTDCARCYHQRIGEWWDLWRTHPEIFDDAIEDERRTGRTYRTVGRDTWPTGLAELRESFAGGRVPKDRRLPVVPGEESCRVCRL